MSFQSELEFRASLERYVNVCRTAHWTPCQLYTWLKQSHGIADSPWLRTLRDACRYVEPPIARE